MARIGQRITPFLWYDDNAEEAAKFYVSVFANSRIVAVTRYDANMAKAAGRPVGSVMTVAFELSGQAFAAINGGPTFKLSVGVCFTDKCYCQDVI
jgi:predicted 3-demethylubiquinone-9 3-methyltransferase (glyoxalase superfamily)